MKIISPFLSAIILFATTSNANGNLRYLDVMIILDESNSMQQLLATKNELYNDFLKLVLENFDFGMEDKQTRIAVLCSGYWEGKTEFRSVTDNRGITRVHGNCPKIGKTVSVKVGWRFVDVQLNLDLSENLHNGFYQAVKKFQIESFRSNVEKVVIVFTDGNFTTEEAELIPCGVNLLNNNTKLFFFHLIEDNKLTDKDRMAMIKASKNVKNVIHFNVTNTEKAKKEFLDAICEYKKANASCKAVPDHENFKCQKNLTGLGVRGCFAPDMEICSESDCDCDEMYPWSDMNTTCSVTCGTGEQAFERKVNNLSNCSQSKVEMCNKEACPTIPSTSITVDINRETTVEEIEEQSSITINRGECFKAIPVVVILLCVIAIFENFYI